MESLKTTFVIIVVATGTLLGINHQEPKHGLILSLIFGLYCLGGYFYDHWKFRRAVEKIRRGASLQKTV